MMRRPTLETMQALTPNLSVVNRDKAHGSRRIISRPWTKTAELRDVHLHFVGARGCPSQLVHWSPELRRRFTGIIRDRYPKMRITNLRAAKHRYESYQKPLARACRLLHGFMAFVIQLVHQPTSEPQRYALKFLTWITDLKYLICGMMADAADELSQLVRFLDTETVETEKLNSYIGRFMWKCHWLFGPRRGALQQGYTKYVMIQLRTPVVWVYRGKTHCIGCETGYSQQSLDSAFDTMAGWLRLAACEIRCEFPSFEVIQSTRIFDVSKERVAPHNKDDFLRLGKLAGVDGSAFQREFERIEPLVREEVNGRKCSNLDGWVNTLRRLMDSRLHVRASFPIDLTLQVAIRWLGIKTSTAGLEQGFSQVDDKVSNKQLGASLNYEEILATLVQNGGRDPPEEIAKAAQVSWFKYGFGKPRQSGEKRRCRIDKGVARTHSQHTEQAFLRKRRSTQCPEISMDDAAKAIDRLQVMNWSPEHAREEEFTKRKEVQRRLDVAGEGLLLAKETSPELEYQAEEAACKRQAAEQDRIRARHHAKQLMSGGGKQLEKPFLRGKSAFVALDTWRPLLAQSSLLHAEKPWQADVYVARNPADCEHVGSVPLWCAVLRGMFVTSKATLTGENGITFKYESALHVRRKLWISDTFTERHPGIAGCIRQCIAVGPCSWAGWEQAPGKWELITNVHHFAALKLRDATAGVCGLVTQSDVRSPDLAGLSHLHTGPQFSVSSKSWM